MARRRYPSDEARLRRPPGVSVAFTIRNPDDPRQGEVFHDAKLRGVWLGLLIVAGQAFAGRTGDRVHLSGGDVCWIAGRRAVPAAVRLLGRVCALMGYALEPHFGEESREGFADFGATSARSWTVHVRNLSQNQGWAPQVRGIPSASESESEDPELRDIPTAPAARSNRARARDVEGDGLGLVNGSGAGAHVAYALDLQSRTGADAAPPAAAPPTAESREAPESGSAPALAATPQTAESADEDLEAICARLELERLERRAASAPPPVSPATALSAALAELAVARRERQAELAAAAPPPPPPVRAAAPPPPRSPAPAPPPPPAARATAAPPPAAARSPRRAAPRWPSNLTRADLSRPEPLRRAYAHALGAGLVPNGDPGVIELLACAQAALRDPSTTNPPALFLTLLRLPLAERHVAQEDEDAARQLLRAWRSAEAEGALAAPARARPLRAAGSAA